MHLFGNMLFLWIYGDNVEYRLGRLAFLLWYLATGVAATLFFAVFALDSTVPLVGASGAISGVLGFYFLWFPRNTVRLFVFLFPFFMNVVAVPARIVLGVYLRHRQHAAVPHLDRRRAAEAWPTARTSAGSWRESAARG